MQTFIVTCIKNTDGITIDGDNPPIPIINGEELRIGRSYEAKHSKIDNHLEILSKRGKRVVVSILPQEWFINK